MSDEHFYQIHNGESYEDADTHVLIHDELYTEGELAELLAKAAERAVAKEVRRDARMLRAEGTSRQELMVEYDWQDYTVSASEDAVLDELVKHFGFKWPEYTASGTMGPRYKRFDREEGSSHER